jgi:hypothetical protein
LVTTVVTPADVVVGRVAVELVKDSLPASRISGHDARQIQGANDRCSVSAVGGSGSCGLVAARATLEERALSAADFCSDLIVAAMLIALGPTLARIPHGGAGGQDAEMLVLTRMQVSGCVRVVAGNIGG